MASEATRQIIGHIAQQGGVPLAELMRLALTHPQWGYYSQAQKVGRKGDFITAPEISQIFGELIGAWLANMWQKQAAPESCILLELGAGRGTLLRDVLRVLDKQKGFASARKVLLLEHNEPARKECQKLCPQAQFITLDELATLPAAPVFCFANEFLDALPIQQYRKHNGSWQARFVVAKSDTLAWQWQDCPPPPIAREAENGALVEHNPQAESTIAQLASHIAQYGGAGVFADYGTLQQETGDSLQAVQAHKSVNVLDAAGDCDITAHVDFARLAQLAKQANCATACTTQRQFLRALGADVRAAQLAKAQPAKAEEVYSGLNRLLHPDAMGVLFKVFAFAPEGVALEGLQ